MTKWMSPQKTMLALAVAAGFSANAGIAAEQVHYHDDYRKTAKLIFSPEPVAQQKQALRDEALAKDFLNRNAKRFGLASTEGLTLSKVQQSLTATHYHYQQSINGVPVWRGEAIVSISKRNGSVTRAFNNTYPTSAVANKTAATKLTAEQALNKAWDYLQGSGQLHFTPQAKLYYVNVGNSLKLAYRTELSATQPQGAWEHVIDAQSGEVLIARRTDLPRKSGANPIEYGNKWPAAAANPEHAPLSDALHVWQERVAVRKMEDSAIKAKANGTALTFDPDPRTTSLSYALQDGSSIPNSAYLTRNLLDLEFSGGVHRLNGPWVRVLEIEAPNAAPSTDADGNWTAMRGSNTFNDGNTYFHLDQSQRYIQSLGFTGANGIIERQMEVDTHGLNGEDNSHYVFGGGGDYLAFGHGCVDDNEDADVILHEYGHAIHQNINSNWDGGDTGAMGEGFGDYWAGSYSVSTTNGSAFDAGQVYTWDGPGCWSGRRMDKTHNQYNAASTYGAHEVVNGVLGDELWATPLFQALLELIRQGVPRAEVDQIILESHFGLGANLTMQDLAQSTVQAADDLYPAEPHAGVFQSKFEQVNILTPTGNHPPIARVSAATLNANVNASVTLNASTSSDGDGDTLTYTWSQLAGTTVTLSGSSTAQATFTAPATAGVLSFRVLVNDGNGGTDMKSILVTVAAPASNGDDDDSGGGGGSFGWLGLMSLLTLAWRRARW